MAGRSPSRPRRGEAAQDPTHAWLKEYARSRDIRIRDRLISHHLPLAQRLARHYSASQQEQFDDLVQVGCIGLLNAVERFDLNQGVSFKTYATHLIVGEIKHYLRDHSALIKPPRELQEMSGKVGKAIQELSISLGKDPSEEELSQHLDIPTEKIRELFQSWQHNTLLSLDQEIASGREGGDGDLTLMDVLEDRQVRSFQLSQEDGIVLQQAMSKIRGQSREVIEFAFYHDLTQTEIAKHLGISQMQVSRRLKTAIGELWKAFNTRVTPW